MTLLLYAGKVIVCSALLFSYYFFFLRNKQFHQYNRSYLLAGTVLSLLLPLVSVSLFPAPDRYDSSLVKTLQVISVQEWEGGIAFPAQQNRFSQVFTLKNSLLIIYLAGVALTGYSFIKSLLSIRTLSKRHRREINNGISFFNTREPGTPFSFFHAVYWNADIELTTREGQNILRHELYHIRAGHSYDIIFMQCISIVCWFNPFFHLYLTELKATHEFMADKHASSTADKWDYAELLVTRAINNKRSSLYNHFFHTQIKRRIHMLIQKNKSGFSYARKMMALPLLAILFCAFSLKKSNHSTNSGMLTSGRTGAITVVIDAGHGGSDPGARGVNGLVEKDVALSIAQKIKSLGSLYGVEVIMTRDDDKFPGNASSTKEGNRNRVTVLQEHNADLFISIHLGAMSMGLKSRGGFDAYISSLNKQYQKSRILGSAILGEVKSIYKVTEVIKEIDRIYVLKNPEVPAVLIDCGYITNNEDATFIIDEKNQENVAHNILKGIVKYQKSVGP